MPHLVPHFWFYALTYLLFLVLLWWAKAQDGNRLVSETGLTTNPRALLLLHVGGILILGLLPLVTRGPLAGLVSPAEPRFQGMATLLTVLLVPLLALGAARLAERKHRAMAPDPASAAALGGAYVSAYFLLRIGFICAYESYFRGYLLRESVEALGIPSAVALNLALYTALHGVNGKAEMAGCVPFGLVLCGLCLWQGATWPAVVVHLALAIPYEVYFLQNLTTLKPGRHEDFSNGSRWLPGH
jgi:membrane protease YdiL (CAAX protease family)